MAFQRLYRNQPTFLPSTFPTTFPTFFPTFFPTTLSTTIPPCVVVCGRLWMDNWVLDLSKDLCDHGLEMERDVCVCQLHDVEGREAWDVYGASTSISWLLDNM